MGRVCRTRPPPHPASPAVHWTPRVLNNIVISRQSDVPSTEYLHGQDDEEAEEDPARLQEARESLEPLPGEDPEEEAVEESPSNQALHHGHRSVVEAGPGLGEADPNPCPWQYQ